MTDLTIREVRTTLLRLPWADDPWLAGHALGPMRDLIVVEVVTASGLAGMGYLHLLNTSLQGTIGTCIGEAMAPRVIGRDATDIEAIWHDLWRSTLTSGRGGVTMMAQSAIDIALWDVVGKGAGLPLHRLWGHYRRDIPTYGSGCFRGSRGDGMIAKAKHFVAQGFKAIKMQVAHVGDLRTDHDNVRRMRDAVGPDIDIMIDVNMGWSADVAITMGRKFEDYDVYWLEEPVLGRRLCRLSAHRRGSRHARGRRRDAFRPRRPQAVPRKPAAADPAAGPDARRTDGVAQARGRRRHLGHDHCAASLPGAQRASARLHPQRHLARAYGALDDLWVEPVPVVDGTIRAPERPGHGLAFRPEVMKDHVVR